MQSQYGQLKRRNLILITINMIIRTRAKIIAIPMLSNKRPIAVTPTSNKI